MCGIVGGVAQRDVTPILIEGLRRLEYRGYDSAGIAVLDEQNQLKRVRVLGKVQELVDAFDDRPIAGVTGIAHTRWATHGEPSAKNAHPHICREQVALVHNGIIENHAQLREQQVSKGYEFTSQTDTEVVVHQVFDHLQTDTDLLQSVQATVRDLQGAYSLGVVCRSEPGRLIAARKGSPLVIGIGIGEYFIASDVFALLPVTQRFIFLEDGDIADITRNSLAIYDIDGRPVQREEKLSQVSADAGDKSGYRHFMLKEIFTQPRAIADTLEGRVQNGRLLEDAFGHGASEIFEQAKCVQIIACGTSFHAGLVAKYWFESVAGIPCSVEVASEYRYRKPCVPEGTLFVTISQSGETADTLAALHEAKRWGVRNTLAICNVPESSLTRDSDLVFLTRAGAEIGVASTKAFTTQLVALLMLMIAIGKHRGLSQDQEALLVGELESLPGLINAALELNDPIERLAKEFADKHHSLFLGRGELYPIAMEGALKLKEISYIHAEAYPAGELKHGPLALVDDDMPIIAVAPNNELIEKLKSNLEEVRARGGRLYVFADSRVVIDQQDEVTILPIPSVDHIIAPIVYTIPLQLFSYHVAVIKGADVDQPRNLAKSVTVE